MHQLLTRMLSIPISSWRIWSAYASVPFTDAQHGLKGPFQIWNFYAYAEHICKELMCMLSNCISSLPVFECMHQIRMCMLRLDISFWHILCSAYAPRPDEYAQHMHQFLTSMLSVRIRSWHICSMYSSVPYAYADGTQNEHLKNGITDVHSEHRHKFLKDMLSVRISSLRVCSAYA
jgi:hypothetical protein